MKHSVEEKYYKSALSNGIAVVSANIPYLRSISIGIWVKAGSRNETPILNGISHFFEHLAFKGTKRRSAHQIAIEMDSIGGHIDAFTSREYTCYSAKVLDKHLPIAVDTLSDILLNSLFDPVEVERERSVILEEINMVEDVCQELWLNGGHIDAYTSREYTCYSAKVLDKHLPIAVDTLSDILLNSLFDPVEVERERSVILEEINMVEDSPDNCIFDILYKKIWPCHSLGLPIQGTPDTVNNITRQDIIDYMGKFCTANNIVISVAGNFDHPSMMDLLEKHFCHFKNADNINRAPVHEIKSGAIARFKKIEQVHICVSTTGININDKQRFECYLLNTILGGSMSSRLFQKIREEKGLAYSVSSSNSIYQDTGIFIVYAATGIKNYRTTIELITQELKEIKNNNIDKDELEKAKNQLKGMLMLSLESSGSRMVNIAKEEMFFGKHFTLDEILNCIDKVTAEGIKDLAIRLFQEQSFNLALLGPIKEKEDLEELLHC